MKIFDIDIVVEISLCLSAQSNGDEDNSEKLFHAFLIKLIIIIIVIVIINLITL